MNTPETYKFTHKGTEYGTTYKLKMWQMERLTGLLHESRKKLFQDMTTKPDGSTDIQLLMKVTVNLADIMSDLMREGKMAEFCAILTEPIANMQQSVEDRAQLFKELDFDHAEEITAFFFNSGSFAKLVMPKYLRKAAAAAGLQEASPSSPGKSTKSPK